MAFLIRNKIVVMFLFACCMTIIVSCEQSILGPEPKNTPEENFEILWKDFDNYYALFDVKKVDWKAQYNVNRPRVNSQTTDDELWDIITNMLASLNDSHVSIYNPNNHRGYTSGRINDYNKNDFSPFVVDVTYLGSNLNLAGNGYIVYGKILNHNIGYIRINTFDSPDNHWYLEIVKVVNDLKDVNAMIIDLRHNPGGYIDVYQYIASAFVDKEIPYMYWRARNGPGHSDFESPTLLSVSPRANQIHFTKNIALLTNRASASASEQFTWLFKYCVPYAIQIGDTTTGIFCSKFPNRQLPNGWYYSFSGALVTSLDGIAPDSLNGIAPDILVLNKEENSYNRVDSVMERSIQYLESKK